MSNHVSKHMTPCWRLCVQACALQPMDVIKTRLQLDTSGVMRGGAQHASISGLAQTGGERDGNGPLICGGLSPPPPPKAREHHRLGPPSAPVTLTAPSACAPVTPSTPYHSHQGLRSALGTRLPPAQTRKHCSRWESCCCTPPHSDHISTSMVAGHGADTHTYKVWACWYCALPVSHPLSAAPPPPRASPYPSAAHLAGQWLVIRWPFASSKACPLPSSSPRPRPHHPSVLPISSPPPPHPRQAQRRTMCPAHQPHVWLRPPRSMNHKLRTLNHKP